MKNFSHAFVRVALLIFIGAIALSPFFAQIAELEGLGLTPQGYIPLAMKLGNTPTPSATPIPTSTSTPAGTPTPTATPPPPNVRFKFIEYNPPGDDVAGEYIEIWNIGGSTQNIEGWYIIPTTFRDGEETLHDPYFFPSYNLTPGSTVRVWTKIGINIPPNYYWNATTEIWRNDGDNARLINNNGSQVHNCSYPGGGVNTTCN